MRTLLARGIEMLVLGLLVMEITWRCLGGFGALEFEIVNL
jgi:hypothetical protein